MLVKVAGGNLCICTTQQDQTDLSTATRDGGADVYHSIPLLCMGTYRWATMCACLDGA